MPERIQRPRSTPLYVGAAALSFAIGALGQFSIGVQAQGGGQAGATAQSNAPIDLTGYWVSVVTEDWRYRMVTPAKGDYASVPINQEGRRVADAWDPAKDTAEGNACKAYGAAAIMRVPGRLRITWQDPNTLKIETDAGQQTRLLHFGAAPPTGGTPDLQGYSVSAWEVFGGRAVLAGGAGQLPAQGGGGGVLQAQDGGRGAARGPRFGDLKVVTTQLKPGYLRKNGVPYSENTEVTEYFDAHNNGNAGQWVTVTTTVHDPKYLAQDFVTSTDFKKEADGAKWHPTPCTAS